MNTKPTPIRPVRRQSHTALSVLGCLLAAFVLFTQPVSSSWAEEFTEQDYDSSGDYQQSYDNSEGYSDESQLDNSDAYDASHVEEIEPTMDPDHADMVRDAKASCTQWANESGLENDDKQAFIDDCVYSQTGY